MCMLLSHFNHTLTSKAELLVLLWKVEQQRRSERLSWKSLDNSKSSPGKMKKIRYQWKETNAERTETSWCETQAKSWKNDIKRMEWNSWRVEAIFYFFSICIHCLMFLLAFVEAFLSRDFLNLELWTIDQQTWMQISWKWIPYCW